MLFRSESPSPATPEGEPHASRPVAFGVTCVAGAIHDSRGCSDLRGSLGPGVIAGRARANRAIAVRGRSWRNGLAQWREWSYNYAGGAVHRPNERMRHQGLRGSWCRVVFGRTWCGTGCLTLISLGKMAPNVAVRLAAGAAQAGPGAPRGARPRPATTPRSSRPGPPRAPASRARTRRCRP